MIECAAAFIADCDCSRFAQRRAECDLETGSSVMLCYISEAKRTIGEEESAADTWHTASKRRGPRLAGTEAHATWYDRSA